MRHPLLRAFHRRMLLLPAVALLVSGACAVRAAEVQVAVAANFAAPMARIAQAFSAASGHTVRLSSGATGKFYSQIVSGAPFEVLLAADEQTPARLVAEKQAVRGTQFTYAIGRLVLWSATPGLVDDKGAVLDSGRFRHIAMANPRLAPYGAAAREVLAARGLTQALAPKVVLGETIAQAYQFVASGNAELGFVALAQVAVAGKPVTGSHWLVPPGMHAEIRQDAVLLQNGARNPAATALLAYLRSEPARQVIDAFGYGRP